MCFHYYYYYYYYYLLSPVCHPMAVNNNNKNIYLLQLGCHPVAVVILRVNKT